MSGSANRIGIVGSGIVGLAHAWAAARAGNQATVLEEFARFGWDLGHACELWTRSTAEERCPGIRRGVAKVYDFPDWTLAERRHGIYAKYPGHAEFRAEPLPGVHIATGMGGSGMTMSFGLADRFFAQRLSSV